MAGAFQRWRAAHPLAREPLEVDARDLSMAPARFHGRRIRATGEWHLAAERSVFAGVWLEPLPGETFSHGTRAARVTGTWVYPQARTRGGFRSRAGVAGPAPGRGHRDGGHRGLPQGLGAAPASHGRAGGARGEHALPLAPVRKADRAGRASRRSGSFSCPPRRVAGWTLARGFTPLRTRDTSRPCILRRKSRHDSTRPESGRSGIVTGVSLPVTRREPAVANLVGSRTC